MDTAGIVSIAFLVILTLLIVRGVRAGGDRPRPSGNRDCDGYGSDGGGGDGGGGD